MSARDGKRAQRDRDADFQRLYAAIVWDQAQVKCTIRHSRMYVEACMQREASSHCQLPCRQCCRRHMPLDVAAMTTTHTDGVLIRTWPCHVSRGLHGLYPLLQCQTH